MEYLILLFLFIILIFSLVVLVFTGNTLFNLIRVKVPYVATPEWAISTIIKYLCLKKGKIVYEIGCGDARFLIRLKEKCPEIIARGYEIAWWPWWQAKMNIKKSGINVDLVKKNFYHENLSQADVVFCFLIHGVMEKVEKKLLEELKPGTIVISYGFKFPNWRPYEIISNLDKPEGSKIYIYQK